jgi:methyl-accepting chemotaxis protein
MKLISIFLTRIKSSLKNIKAVLTIFVLVIILAAVNYAFNLERLKTIASHGRESYNEAVLPMMEYAKVSSSVSLLKNYLYRHISEVDDEEMTGVFDEIILEFETLKDLMTELGIYQLERKLPAINANELYDLFSNEIDDEMQKRIKVTLSTYVDDLQKQINVLIESSVQFMKEEAAIELNEGTLADDFSVIELLVNFYLDEAANKTAIQVDQDEHLGENTIKSSGLLSLMSGFILCLVILRFSNKMALKMGVITTALDGASQGKLNTRLNPQELDQFHEIGEFFNQLLENTSKIITSFGKTASNVSQSSDQIVADAGENASRIDNVVELSNKIKTGSDRQNKGMKNVRKDINEIKILSKLVQEAFDEQSLQSSTSAVGVSEINDAIGQVTIDIAEISDFSSKMLSAAKNGSDKVLDSVESINQIDVKVTKISEQISKMSKSSDQIGEIITAITEIASQTNLLALNAAIEAARAGDAGKGFAVVADEVRKLAERSAEAATEISTLIYGMQDITKQSETFMNEGTEDVKRGVSLAEEAQGALKQILEMVEKTGNQIQNISAAAEEVSASSSETTLIIQALNDSVSGTSSKVTNVSQIVEQIDHSVGEAISVANENNFATIESATYINDVADLTSKGAEAIKGLNQDILSLQEDLSKLTI